MKKTFLIEKLDSGFIVTENGKRKAVTDTDQLKQVVLGQADEIVGRIVEAGISNMAVIIEIQTNFPTPA
jgi:hypothetical protein